jgi:hypothetical protein
MLFQYVDEMFRVGSELENVLKAKSAPGTGLLRVGISDRA